MNSPACRNCSRQTQDGTQLCSTCTLEWARQLRAVPDLMEHLLITYTKQDRLGPSNGHRGKPPHTPLPVRLNTSRVIDALTNEITTWAKALVDHHGWDTPTPPPRRPHNGPRGVVIPSSSPSTNLACFTATWLAQHINQLRCHPAAMQAHRALTSAIKAAQTAIDKPEPQLFIGYCQPCSGPLYAPRHATGTTCERCGAYVTDLTQRWDAALLKLRGYPATAAVIAGWVGEVSGVMINRKLINIWHHRGLIRAVDTDPDTGDPRFRIGEVLDKAANSKPRKADRR